LKYSGLNFSTVRTMRCILESQRTLEDRVETYQQLQDFCVREIPESFTASLNSQRRLRYLKYLW
jgi:hypothetical protein